MYEGRLSALSRDSRCGGKVRGEPSFTSERRGVNPADMPMTDDIYWATDHDAFLSLPGGQAIVDWFGFVPSFHDATLEKLELATGTASIVLKAFRMTKEIDSKGYFVLDKHALVTIKLSEVTGIQLEGESGLIISDLGIRRLSEKPSGWHDGTGPCRGDFEVAWESCWGFDGALFAREVTLAFDPTEA